MIIPSASSGIVAAYVPARLRGLELWLSADFGVSTNASNQITAWRDQSSNAFTFVPDAASAQFTYSSSTAGLNNKPSIVCSTSVTANNGLFNATTFTTRSVFIVYILTSIAGFEYSVVFEGNGANLYTSYGFSNRRFGSYLNNFYDATTLSTLSTSYMRSLITQAGTTTAFFINGRADGTPLGNGFFTRTQTVIGNGGARLARAGGTLNQPFQGNIAELICYNRTLPTEERRRVEAYLREKYAITS